MDRDLVFRLKTVVDYERVGETLRQLAVMHQGQDITIPVNVAIANPQAIQNQLAGHAAPVGVGSMHGGLNWQGNVSSYAAPPGAPQPPPFNAEPPIATTVVPIVATPGRPAGGMPIDGTDPQEVSDKVNNSNTRLRQGLLQTLDALMQVGRGFAYLGVAGEEDLQKILKVLVSVEASINLIRGGIDVFRGLATAATAYSSALHGVGVASKAAGLSGGGGTDAATDATESLVTHAEAIGGGAVSAKAGGMAARLGGLGKMAGAAVGPVAALLAAIAGGGAGIKSAYEFATGRERPHGAEEMFFSHPEDIRIGSWNESAGSMYASGADWVWSWFPKEMRRDVVEGWENRGWTKPGEWDNYNPFSTSIASLDSYQNRVRTERMINRRTRRYEAGGHQRLTLGVKQDDMFERSAMQRRRMEEEDQLRDQFTGSAAVRREREERDRSLELASQGALGSWLSSELYNWDRGAVSLGAVRDVQLDLQQQHAATRLQDVGHEYTISSGLTSRAYGLNMAFRDAGMERQAAQRALASSYGPSGEVNVTQEQQSALQERMEAAERRLQDLTKQRISLEGDLRREKEQTLAQTVRNLQEEVAAQNQSIEAAGRKYTNQQTNFGLMDLGDAYRLRSAGMRMQRIKELDAAGRGDEAMMYRRGLAPEELRLLAYSGDEDSEDFVREEGMRRARERGMDTMFSGRTFKQAEAARERRDNVEGVLKQRQADLSGIANVNRDMEQGAGQFNIELKDNRELNVNLVRDDSAIVTAAVAGVRAQLDERDRALLRMLDDRLRQEFSRIANMRDQDAVTAGFGRRK